MNKLLHLWLIPGGRASLSDLWLKTLVPVIVLVLVVSNVLILVESYDVAYYFLMPVGFWPLLNVYIKRLHDRDHSGWYFLLAGVPLVNIFVFIEIFFLQGTTGENKYGQDSVARGAHEQVITLPQIHPLIKTCPKCGTESKSSFCPKCHALIMS